MGKFHALIRRNRRFPRPLAWWGVLVLALVAPLPQANAACFTVDTTTYTYDAVPGDGVCADSNGSCSLVAATIEANALPGPDTIYLPAGVYLPAYPCPAPNSNLYLVVIDSDVTLIGQGASSTVLDAGGTCGVLAIKSGTVSISGVTLQNGLIDSGDGIDGGAGLIVYPSATGSVVDSVIQTNMAVATGSGSGFGGGVANGGTLTLTRVAVTQNQATSGGGIVAIDEDTPSSTTVIDSTITGNSATGNATVTFPCGGGVWTEGFVWISGTTIEGNGANYGGSGCGGAVFVQRPNGQVYLDRSLIYGNRSPAIQNQSDLYVTNTTFNNNKPPSGIATNGGLAVTTSSASGHTAVSYLTNVTVFENRDGAMGSMASAVRSQDDGSAQSVTYLKNTIIAGTIPSSLAECSTGTSSYEPSAFLSQIVSLDYNVVDDNSCHLGMPHDWTGPGLLLDPLADYGGPTKTHRMRTDSAVGYNSVPPADCSHPTLAAPPILDDQRGAGRPAEGFCERGAYEVSVCGDGLSGGAEQCDDGNASGGDGCSAACQLETVCGNGAIEAGEVCDDGNAADEDGCSSDCTVETGWSCSGAPSSCSFGDPICVGGTPQRCPAVPVSGCLSPGKASLLIKNRTLSGSDPNRADKLVWQWLNGPAMDVSDLGNPLALSNPTQYHLCVYDTQAGSPRLVLSSSTDPSVSAWASLGSTGYNYKDDLIPDGLQKLSLKAGTAAGQSRIKVIGKGGNLLLPASAGLFSYFEQSPVVVVQLRRSDAATCWESRFDAGAVRNASDQFKDFCGKGGEPLCP